MHHGKGFLDLCLFYNNKSPKVPRRFLCFVSLSGPMSHCVASSLRTDPGALSSPSSYAGARTSTRFDLPDVCVGGRCSFTGTRAFSRAVIAAPKTKEKKKLQLKRNRLFQTDIDLFVRLPTSHSACLRHTWVPLL